MTDAHSNHKEDYPCVRMLLYNCSIMLDTYTTRNIQFLEHYIIHRNFIDRFDYVINILAVSKIRAKHDVQVNIIKHNMTLLRCYADVGIEKRIYANVKCSQKARSNRPLEIDVCSVNVTL